MATLSAPDTAFSAELDFLLKRRSCHQLRAPGPSDAELAQILQAGQRAPDFGRLRPYRFLAARGNGLDRLGQAMQRAAIAAGKSEQIVARALTMPHRAPLVIIVVATPRPDKNVPEFDQVLCAASQPTTGQRAISALATKPTICWLWIISMSIQLTWLATSSTPPGNGVPERDTRRPKTRSSPPDHSCTMRCSSGRPPTRQSRHGGNMDSNTSGSPKNRCTRSQGMR